MPASSQLAARSSQLALVLAAMPAAAFGQITTIYVDGGATSSGSGLGSFTNALMTLEEALDPVNGPLSTFQEIEIRVTEGTYVPNGTLSFGSIAGPRAAAFVVPDGVSEIRGSYSPSDTSVDPTGAATILSGDLGLAADPTDNCFHTVVLDASGQIRELQLRDLTIQDGYADDLDLLGTEAYGGGVLAYGARVRFTEVAVRDNYAVVGGGIAGLRNTAGGEDYPVEMRGRRLRVRDNTARLFGAGLYASGGMYSSFASSTFRSNTGVIEGGGIFIESDVIDFEAASSRIFDNTAERGGGVFSSIPSSGGHRLLNCTVAYNTAFDVGGGVYVEGGDPITGERSLHNSIIFENSGGGVSAQDNVFNGVSPIAVNYSPGLSISYDHSFVGDADPTSFPIPAGEPIVDAQSPSTLVPGWVNGAARNFRLVSGSVCIDRGDDRLLDSDFADIDDDGDTSNMDPLPREFYMVDIGFTPNPNVTTREAFVSGAASTMTGLISGFDAGQASGPICDIGAFEHRIYDNPDPQ